MAPCIVMVGADKGGVGKTTVTRVLLDYLAQNGVSTRVFDTEWPGGDLKRFFPVSEIIDISKVQDQMKVFDVTDGVTVVDLRAGLLSPTLQELDNAKLLDDVREGTMNLILLHVLGPTIASIGEIASAAEKIGGGAKHFLVKNHINDTQFFDWDKDQENSPLRRMEDVTINVPQLTEIACEIIQKEGGSFADFIKNLSQSRILRGRVASWSQEVWSEFDRVGLLGTIRG